MDSAKWGVPAAPDAAGWHIAEHPWEAALRALGEIAAAAAAAPDVHELARLAVRSISELISCSSVALYWLEPSTAKLISLADSDPEVPQTGRETSRKSAAWQAFATGEPVIVEDYAAWPHAVPAFVRSGIVSVAGVPLICAGEAVGSISVRSRQRLGIDAELLRLLSLFATQMAPVLQTARLYAQSERRRSTAEALVELSRVTDGDQPLLGTVQALAERACQLVGADFAYVALLGADQKVVAVGQHGLSRPFPPEGMPLVRTSPVGRVVDSGQTLVVPFNGEEGEFRRQNLRIAEQEQARIAAYVPLPGPHGARGALALGWRRDTQPTEEQLRLAETLAAYAATLIRQRQSEQARVGSEARYRRIVETAQEGICTTDMQGRLEYVNARLCDMLGYRSHELLGRFETDLLARSVNATPGALMALLPRGHRRADFRLARKDGSELWASVSTGPISEADPAAGGITLITDISHRKEAEERLRMQAFYDALTGLPNRALLEDRVLQGILGVRRTLDALALLFVDLDRFKVVNDTWGHATGDEVLRQVAARMQQAVRESDTVARLGGDEFVIFLRSISGREDAVRAVERIRDTLRMPFLVHDHRVTLGASVGLAVYPVDGDDFETLLRTADEAMYEVKRAASAD
jgi:diguanylate cyclase (GGDEF)-like protein/PAS domain S-box-containing protein